MFDNTFISGLKNSVNIVRLENSRVANNFYSVVEAWSKIP